MTGPRPLRVLVLGHTAVRSGAEIALVRLLRRIDPTTVELKVVLFADGPLVDELRSTGIDVAILPLAADLARANRQSVGLFSLRNVASAIRMIRFVLRLRRLIVALNVDVVHCNSLKADLIGGVAGRLARRRVVWYLHDRISADYLPARVVSVFRLLARRIPDGLIANSKATLATVAPYPAGRSTIAYPGLDIDDAKPGPRQSPPGAPVIGMVGRISPTKGQEVFVRAAAIVAPAHPTARFAITGAALFDERDYEADVRRLAVNLGLGEVVEFRGHVADVRAEFDGFAALVHASPVPEPFGQVVIEAMLAGTPVVATRGGGIDEIVEGDIALLVSPGDPSALADAISEILDHPDQAELRAERAAASVRARFSIDDTAAAVTAAWFRAATRKRTTRRQRATG